MTSTLAFLLVASLAGCQVGEGRADSLAIAQITPTSGSAVTFPLKDSDAALSGLHTIALHASFEDFAGVDTAALRKRVESRLRQAGLAMDSTSSAVLLLRCFALPGSTGIIGYTCSIDLSDVVSYGFPPKGRYQAILWGAAPIIGLAGRDHLADGVGQIVDEEVGSFLAAWSKMNPQARDSAAR